jgi:hypothetical protein
MSEFSFFEDTATTSPTTPAEKLVVETSPLSAFPPENIKEIYPEKKAKTVSFSQYAMWLKCPNQWRLSYMEHLSKYEDTIHTAFGKAIHTVVQLYLKTLYTLGSIEADKLDCVAIFDVEYAKEIAKMKTEAPPTSEEVEEFKTDGKNIIDHFVSYAIRSKHFPSKKYEVLGIELPLAIPIRGGALTYKGFLDIVLKDKSTGKVHILDIKTSSKGWNKYQKVDRTKLDQLILYKRFYNQLYKVPMNDIEIEFIVLKRKLFVDVAWPQSRIQRISPPDGKMSIKEVEGSFLEFINECFDAHGEYNKQTVFRKNPGKAKKNCKYCMFKELINPITKEKYCDGKED